jgi:hypothetical protein
VVTGGKPVTDLAAALDQVVAELADRYPDRSRDEIARRVGQLAAELASRATVAQFLPVLVARSVCGEFDNGGSGGNGGSRGNGGNGGNGGAAFSVE